VVSYRLAWWFRNRVLPVTHAIADRWGELDGQCQLKGRPLNTADGLIAATAVEHEPDRGDAQRQTFRRPRRYHLQPVGTAVAASVSMRREAPREFFRPALPRFR
jgi:hypothetical protein